MIVVIGEALIDLIEDKSSKGSYQAVVGGANANVAIALARAGLKQQLLARLSGDAFGQKIRNHLASNGVGLDFAISAAEPTSLAIASIGESGGAKYSFYVDATADWGWSIAELPSLEKLKAIEASTLQFGCLTMAMEPGNKIIEAWAREIFDENVMTISHDVNVRPALGFDVDAERERVERINSISHLIKASDDDINWLYGLEAGSNVDQIAAGWIGDTEKVVFVTRGGDGVSIYRRGGVRLDVEARKVNVQDTVGAGDTFCANALAGLEKLAALGSNPLVRLAKVSDEELVQLAQIAAVAASMACEKTGAEPPTKSELEAKLLELGLS